MSGGDDAADTRIAESLMGKILPVLNNKLTSNELWAIDDQNCRKLQDMCGRLLPQLLTRVAAHVSEVGLRTPAQIFTKKEETEELPPLESEIKFFFEFTDNSADKCNISFAYDGAFFPSTAWVLTPDERSLFNVNVCSAYWVTFDNEDVEDDHVAQLSCFAKDGVNSHGADHMLGSSFTDMCLLAM
jgi:hypothetical protein